MNLKDIKPLALLRGYLIKIFPFLGYKGVVSHQLRLYKKLKRMNARSLKEWSKTASPAVGTENLMDGKNIRSGLTIEDIDKFRANNRSNKFTAPYS